MTTTHIDPTDNQPLPEEPRPNARPDVQEAYLEKYFRRMVRVCLRGKVVKLAPIEAGTPDDLVLLPGGVSSLVELKADRGRVDDLQRVWHARAGQLGHRVVVLYGQAGIDHWVAEMQRQLDPTIQRTAVPAPVGKRNAPAGRKAPLAKPAPPKRKGMF